MQEIRIIYRLPLSFLILGLGIFALSAQETDRFSQELKSLRQQRVADVGQVPLAQAYEAFIDKYAADSRVAEAMFDLGSVYEIENPEEGVKADPILALKWYRNAAATAAPGSDISLRSQQFVIHRISDPAEKRSIIEWMSRHAKDDLAVQVQVEKNWMDVCILEENFTDAEKHCRRILNWYDDPANVPRDLDVKSKIDSQMRTVANELVLRLAESSLPKAEREKRIKKLAKDFPYNQDIYFAKLDSALKLSGGRRDTRVSNAPLFAATSYVRTMLISATVLVMVALIGWAFARRKLCCSS